MNTNCFAIRPGSIFKYKNEIWKVLENDTLNQILVILSRDSQSRKRIHYSSGMEINLRWTPHTRQ